MSALTENFTPGFVRRKIAANSSQLSVRRSLAKRAEIRLRRIAEERGPVAPNIADHWQPNPGPQELFFNSDCREILYGGAAGGGKSAALTALPLKWAHLKGFESVIFRRETTQLDDLIKKSTDLVPGVFPGLSPVHSPYFEWRFPAGGKLKYRHLQHEKDFKIFDGWEINLLCFDELTHFTEKQYKYLCARVRSSDPRLPRLIRATTNPGGPGHEWVIRRWGAWLDPEFEAKGLTTRFGPDGEKLPPAKPGEMWWIRTVDGVEEYFREKPDGSPVALSRMFIPAKVEDCPQLSEDHEYVAQLEGLDNVRRAQLRDGDWLIRPAAGLYFKRGWVELRDSPGPIVRKLRAWDLAASEKKLASDDPDWTVGLLLGLCAQGGETWYEVLDVIRQRLSPGGVKALVRQTAQLDGEETPVFIPQDPGQAGKSQAYDYATLLEGYQFLSAPVTGDKGTRFGPFSSACEHGRVKVLNRPWTTEYLSELEAFPTLGIHDDQVDASSDAFKMLVSTASVFDSY